MTRDWHKSGVRKIRRTSEIWSLTEWTTDCLGSKTSSIRSTDKRGNE